MSCVHLLVERDDGIFTLVINRPRALNAPDAAAVIEPAAAVGGGEADPSVGAVVSTGDGESTGR